MKIIKINELDGKSITEYDSDFIMQKILMTDKPAHVGIMQLDEGGIVGYHEATVPQILVVLEGEGWVRTGTDCKVRIAVGDAVLWEKGEGHETSTEKRLIAIVIESEGLEISSF